jgi:hypothetical protein
MATLVITIVTPDSVASVTDALNTVPSSGSITEPSSIDHIARYVDGLANGSLNMTSVTTAIS